MRIANDPLGQRHYLYFAISTYFVTTQAEILEERDWS